MWSCRGCPVCQRSPTWAESKASRCRRHRPQKVRYLHLSQRRRQSGRRGCVRGSSGAAARANKSDPPVAERQSDAVLAPQMQSNVEGRNEISRTCREGRHFGGGGLCPGGICMPGNGPLGCSPPPPGIRRGARVLVWGGEHRPHSRSTTLVEVGGRSGRRMEGEARPGWDGSRTRVWTMWMEEGRWQQPCHLEPTLTDDGMVMATEADEFQSGSTGLRP